MESSKVFSVIFIVCFFLFSSCNEKEKYVTVKPVEYKLALNNPLKGFRPSLESIDKKERPYNSIVRSYLKWNELERNGNDGIEQIKLVCDQKWDGLAEKNIKVIPRVYLDWDSKEGNEYWPEDMKKGDYESEQFKQRLTRLVNRLGEIWDNDPRIAWIQMGIIGYWGEQHHPKPNEWQQELLGDLFSKAFKNKKVIVRRPYESFENYDFGWYWDSFAHWNQINTQMESMVKICPDRWRTAPIEGECAYNWGEYQIQPGENPNETLKDPMHRKWLIDHIRKLHCTGLGWVSEYDAGDAQVLSGAEEVQKAFGYRFILQEVTYPKRISSNEQFQISFKVQNTGAAPFYYEWPVELHLLDVKTHELVWKQEFGNTDIRNWMPGDNWNTDQQLYDIPAPVVENSETFNITSKIPDGGYILALAILDPAGMKPSVKFATEQYFKGGIHPIGKVGINKSIHHFQLDSKVFDNPGEDNSISYMVL